LNALARAGDHHRCADLAIYLHPTEALYRTRTDDPFLTMEGPGHGDVTRCYPMATKGLQPHAIAWRIT
jgi:hypothetical protein